MSQEVLVAIAFLTVPLLAMSLVRGTRWWWVPGAVLLAGGAALFAAVPIRDEEVPFAFLVYGLPGCVCAVYGILCLVLLTPRKPPPPSPPREPKLPTATVVPRD